ncbi:hypothetical protein EG68_04059 [Paragonimus skrjabini miyazakii]|uniref:Uncharacterized protein n=1 Tax=Paragonimus skrjabini miyazakii TaxID=59628 RepID=A0A8S9YZT2_9TREM|nr:hypothetical protein EG68_04059 [Paragonimus skrjabini miyazakii]
MVEVFKVSTILARNVTSSGSGSNSVTVPDEHKVYGQIMQDYETAARPLLNQSEKMMVTVRISMKQIVDLNGHTQMLTTLLYIEQMWKDDFLVWNESPMSHVRSLRVPASRVWTPDTFVFNNADTENSGFLAGQHVLVRNTGLVVMPVSVKLKTSCRVDISFFPFDKQICDIQIGSWIYQFTRMEYRFHVGNWTVRTARKKSVSNDVQERVPPAYNPLNYVCRTANTDNDALDLSSYWDSSDWIFIAVSLHHVYRPTTGLHVWRPKRGTWSKSMVSNGTGQVDLVFRLYVRRQSFFYIWNIVIPCLLLTLLSSVVFWTPVKSGEKITLGLSVFLAFSMFMVLIAEEVPPSAERIPLIGIYMTTVMTLTAASVVGCVIVINVDDRGTKLRRAPTWLQRLLRTRAAVWLLVVRGAEQETCKQITVEPVTRIRSKLRCKTIIDAKRSLLQLQTMLAQCKGTLELISTHLRSESTYTTISDAPAMKPQTIGTKDVSQFQHLARKNLRCIRAKPEQLAGDEPHHHQSTARSPLVPINTSSVIITAHDKDPDRLKWNQQKCYRKLVQFEWDQVARLFDIFFFIIFIIATCACYLIIFLWPVLSATDKAWSSIKCDE